MTSHSLSGNKNGLWLHNLSEVLVDVALLADWNQVSTGRAEHHMVIFPLNGYRDLWKWAAEDSLVTRCFKSFPDFL